MESSSTDLPTKKNTAPLTIPTTSRTANNKQQTGLEKWSDSKMISNLRNLAQPAMVDDVKDMFSGRKFWRRTATATETIGKVLLATSTVLAFASASDIANDHTSRILGFVSGSVGTTGLVLAAFANFSRTQAIERTDAANLILGAVKIESVPDINDELLISDGDGT